jgi:hypothetical protein
MPEQIPGDAAATAVTPAVRTPAGPEDAETGVIDVIRPGPDVLQADTWDSPPDDHRGVEEYQGRRRATLPWRRIAVIVALLLAVAAIFVVPQLLKGSSTPRSDATNGPDMRDGFGGATDPATTVDSGELVPAASSPAGRGATRPGPPAGSSASASTGPSAGATTPATQPTSGPPPSSAQPPTAAPITLQAEAAQGISSWQVDSGASCSVGSQVVRTGKWLQYSRTPGLITFHATIETAGSYNVTIYSVASSGSGTRTAEILVNSASVTSPTFPEGCSVVRSVKANLVKGDNRILFTNQNNPGPSIDRIVITKA